MRNFSWGGCQSAMTSVSSYNRGDKQGNRALLTAWFLKGSGIEVGALHSPLLVPAGTNVKYVDRLPTSALRQHYPELDALDLVEPDIIDDGQRLSRVADVSQDFVIANHFVEHCEDPIGTVENFLRVLKPGGYLYMAIPDRDATFDRERPITPFSHLVLDYEQGPQNSKWGHFMEWARFVDRAEPGEAQRLRAQSLLDKDYSIHFHVWDKPAMLDLVYQLRTRMNLPLNPVVFFDNGEEGIWILAK
jgi:SAM-dependent methyltransferase